MVPLVWLAAWTILCPDWDQPGEFLRRLHDIYGWNLSLPHWIADHCHPVNGIQTCAFTGYDRYSLPFAVLWMIALGYLIAGVILPLYRVHGRMVRAKREVTDLVRPELSRRAFDGRQRIAAARTPDQMLDALDSYARNAKAADDVRKLSVWPLDIRTIAIFSTTKTVAYGVPLAVYMAATSHKVDSQLAHVFIAPLQILQYAVRLIF
jgi:hypothetical protein